MSSFDASSDPAASNEALDDELKRLLVGTNEQRRLVGQTLYHFYRTLVFWRERGSGFFHTTKLWSGAGASVFDNLATTLQALGEPSEDGPLRAFLVAWAIQLADDLERGDGMFVPYLRWLEQRFPVLTTMMQEEQADSLIFDVELCRVMAGALGRVALATRDEAISLLRTAAHAL